MLEELSALDHAVADWDHFPLAFIERSAMRKPLISILSKTDPSNLVAPFTPVIAAN
jgi:hypothetical protein